MYLESLVSGHPDFQDPNPRQNYPKPDTVRLIKQKYYFFRHWIRYVLGFIIRFFYNRQILTYRGRN